MNEADQRFIDTVNDQRFLDAMHSIELSIRQRMWHDKNDTSPINTRLETIAALVESGALSELLMEKDIFTKSEYQEKLALHAEAQKLIYDSWIKNHIRTRTVTTAELDERQGVL